MAQIDKEKQLLDYDGEDKVISSQEALEKLKNSKGAFKFHCTMPLLDKAMEGFEPGELIIVSGITKHGKTTFSQSLTKQFESQEVKCLWFEFEVPERQFIERFPDLPLFYLPNQLKDKNIPWIKDRILEGKLKYGVRVVFIDHLHYLIDMYTQNASMDIGRAIRDLKRFAVEEDIIIITMSHLKKTEPDVVPNESDIRDSSFIPQEADSTLIIWRESKRKRGRIEYTGKTFLIVANHRRTGVMGKTIELVFRDGYFYEQDGVMEEGVDNTLLDSMF